MKVKSISLSIALFLLPSLLMSQKSPLEPWQNPEVNEVNRMAAHARILRLQALLSLRRAGQHPHRLLSDKRRSPGHCLSASQWQARHHLRQYQQRGKAPQHPARQEISEHKSRCPFLQHICRKIRKVYETNRFFRIGNGCRLGAGSTVSKL